MKNKLYYHDEIYKTDDNLNGYGLITHDTYYEMDIDIGINTFKNFGYPLIKTTCDFEVTKILEYEALNGKKTTPTTRRISSRNNKTTIKRNKKIKPRNRKAK